jgi:type I restriction enzyme S subunit
MTDWPEVRLGEILVLEYGKPLAAGRRSSDGKYVAYGANGAKARSNDFHVDGESIIVGRKGSAGELVRVSGRWWPLDVTYYVVHQHSLIDIEYLYLAMQTLKLPSLARGVKPGINRNDVYDLRIRLPPLDEQVRIVAKLDEARRQLDRLTRNLDEQRSLVESLRERTLLAAVAGRR